MHTVYHGDGRFDLKFKSPEEEAEFQEAFQALAKCSHNWEQSYLDPYASTDEPWLSKPWKDVLLDGAKPIVGEYRCSRCHAIGRYQDLPPTVSYEPIIVRIR